MRGLILSFLFCLSATAFSQKSEPVFVVSDYKKGDFITTVKITVNASHDKTNEVLNKFISQYHNDLDALFGWALKDLKLKGEEDKFIMFNLRSHTYDKSKNQIKGAMDIHVGPLNQDFASTTYETTLTKKESGSNTTIVYEILRCDNVIEHVDASFKVLQKADNIAEIVFDVAFTPKRPYHLMTKKQYRENIEWRFGKFLSNIRDEAEKH